MTSTMPIRLLPGALVALAAAAVIMAAPVEAQAAGNGENSESGATAQGTRESTSVEEPAEPSLQDTSWIYELSPEDLFLRASSSALQFQSMIAPSRRRLVADHETSLPYLVTRLDTDDARERHALEDILVKIGEPAVGPVVEAFRDEMGRTGTTRGARLAASVLGRLGDAAAVAPLGEARSHDDWKVRGAVAGALGRIGIAEAVPALVDLLLDANEIVRKSAAFGLGRTASSVSEACGCSGATAGSEWRRATGELADALDDPYYAVRYNASDALARIGEPAWPALRDILRGDPGTARLMALRAVAEIGSEEAGPIVSQLLSSDDWAERAQAAHTLGVLGVDRSRRRALERIREEGDHPFVLMRIEEALSGK